MRSEQEVTITYKTNLHQWRKEKGVSRAEMAFDLNITEQYIQMTENTASKHNLSFSTMMQFCNYFDKDIIELFIDNGI